MKKTGKKTCTLELQRIIDILHEGIPRGMPKPPIKEMAETIGLGALTKKQYKDLEVIKEYVAQLSAKKCRKFGIMGFFSRPQIAPVDFL